MRYECTNSLIWGLSRQKRRSHFSVLKASEGGMGVVMAKQLLEANGVKDVKIDYSPYVGHSALTVPFKYARKTSRLLYK